METNQGNYLKNQKLKILADGVISVLSVNYHPSDRVISVLKC